MKIFSSKRRVAAIGAVTALTLVGGGAAYAYWTTTGTGTGSASTGTDTAFGVAITSTDTPPVTPLAPGTGTQNFTVKATNPAEAGVQRLSSIVVKVANVDGTAWLPPGGCTAADYQLNAEAAGASATLTPAPVVDLAPTDSWSGTLTVKMVNRPVDQWNCKGLTVPLYATAS